MMRATGNRKVIPFHERHIAIVSGRVGARLDAPRRTEHAIVIVKAYQMVRWSECNNPTFRLSDVPTPRLPTGNIARDGSQ